MDRMPPSEGGDAGSIPAKGTRINKVSECPLGAPQLLVVRQESNGGACCKATASRVRQYLVNEKPCFE